MSESTKQRPAPNVAECTCDRDDDSWVGEPVDMPLCPYHEKRLRHLSWESLVCMVIDYEAALAALPQPGELTYIEVRTTACHAGSDGDCSWNDCPQLRDGEPVKSHRHCPLDAVPVRPWTPSQPGEPT